MGKLMRMILLIVVALSGAELRPFVIAEDLRNNNDLDVLVKNRLR